MFSEPLKRPYPDSAWQAARVAVARAAWENVYVFVMVVVGVAAVAVTVAALTQATGAIDEVATAANMLPALLLENGATEEAIAELGLRAYAVTAVVV